jgi:phage shock protein PspC (stress-responsive transcriptional regulator)
VSPRRLYRSRRDRWLAGVAGGIAEYLDVDPVVIRLLWILSIFVGGFGILLYIIMAFIVPLEPAQPVTPGWGPAGGTAWGPAAAAAPGATPAAAPGTTPGTGAPGPAGEPGAVAGAEPAPGADTDGGSASAAMAPAWASSQAWATPDGGWQQPAPGTAWQPPAEREPGRGGLVVGTVLVVFGGIALLNVLAPGWIAGGWVVAALLVALGVALLVGATRPTASAS